MDESSDSGNTAKGSRRGRGRSGLGRREAKAYQWAVEAALAIPVGFGLGYFVDAELGTNPIALIIGGALGFAAFVQRLLRLRSLVGGGGGGDGDEADGAERGDGAPESERRHDQGRSGP